MNRRKIAILAGLAMAAAVAAAIEFAPPARTAPPPPPGTVNLRGKFIGAQAAQDAAAFAGLCRGLAAALRADAARPDPRIKTGVQLEDVRVAAAEGRFLPRSLSREQPHATAAAGQFLDQTAGTSGGPLDAAGRERWAKALDDLAAAAEEAVR